MIHRSWSLLASAALLVAPPATAGGGRDGEVRAVSLLPSSGRAELVIAVQGAVTIADRTLPDPSRIVLDVSGATLAAGMDRISYDDSTVFVNLAGDAVEQSPSQVLAVAGAAD